VVEASSRRVETAEDAAIQLVELQRGFCVCYTIPAHCSVCYSKRWRSARLPDAAPALSCSPSILADPATSHNPPHSYGRAALQTHLESSPQLLHLHLPLQPHAAPSTARTAS
jgi:hypothetical protein